MAAFSTGIECVGDAYGQADASCNMMHRWMYHRSAVVLIANENTDTLEYLPQVYTVVVRILRFAVDALTAALRVGIVFTVYAIGCFLPAVALGMFFKVASCFPNATGSPGWTIRLPRPAVLRHAAVLEWMHRCEQHVRR